MTAHRKKKLNDVDAATRARMMRARASGVSVEEIRRRFRVSEHLVRRVMAETEPVQSERGA